MKDLTEKGDTDMLYPAGVTEGTVSPDEANDILYPAGVGPANEGTNPVSGGCCDDEEILLPPLLD